MSLLGLSFILYVLEHLLRYLPALPTIRVHPELDGRTLDIVQSLKGKPVFYRLKLRCEAFTQATLGCKFHLAQILPRFTEVKSSALSSLCGWLRKEVTPKTF